MDERPILTPNWVTPTPVLLTSLSEATKLALRLLNIRTKIDLDNKGGPTMSGLYQRIQELTNPTAWSNVDDPKASIRFYYQMELPGYRIYRA